MDSSNAIFTLLVILAAILAVIGIPTKNYALLVVVLAILFIPAFDSFDSIS